MDTLLSLFEDLLWWVPWHDPLGRGRAFDKQSQLRLRVALENELQCRDRIGLPQPDAAI